MSLTKRGRLAVAVAILVGLGVVAAGAGAVYLRSIGVGGTSKKGELIEVTIPKGAAAESIGEILEKAGVIESARAFRIAAFLGEGEENIQAGLYELPQGLTATDALEMLVDARPIENFVNVTFPEGSWLTDFARILEDNTHIDGNEFLKLVANGKIDSEYRPSDVDTMEGLLFPSTYQVIEKDTARSVAERLAGEFERQLDDLDFSTVEEMGISRYEAITVASMIEAEAGVAEDRDKIAAVIYNRVEEGMTLGIDATVSYALGEHIEELTLSDLEVDSPYNTRKYPGIPPTPIGAPGRASLEAALAPADGSWLYYVVSDCEGHHAFSTSYDEFLENKAAYQALEC